MSVASASARPTPWGVELRTTEVILHGVAANGAADGVALGDAALGLDVGQLWHPSRVLPPSAARHTRPEDHSQVITCGGSG